MSNLLQKHQKKEIRYESKDFRLYNPTESQRTELMQIAMDNSKIEGDNLTAEYGLNIVRSIFRELTNIGSEIDELSDDELGTLLDNGDRELELLVKEITTLLEEISEDVVYSITKQVKIANDLINSLDVNGDAEKLKNKFNKFAKKYKLKTDWDSLIANSEEQEKLVKELNNGTK